MGASSISVKWLDDIEYAARDLGADACIFGGVHACKHTLGTISYLRRELMKRSGLPTLILMGDVMDKRHLPMDMFQDEVKVFVDQIIGKKKASRRRKKAAPAAGESG
jgi:hypothetical protein